MKHSINAESKIRVEEWLPRNSLVDASRLTAFEGDLNMLAEVLQAVVHGGASVSFFTPFSINEARAFWREKVLPGVQAGTRRVVVARDGGRIVGTVQLQLEMPPNQRHRAEVAKLLVHPDARRRGIAKSLMTALEEIAISEGRTLLTLDTVTGSGAESLYRELGYITVGIVPRYARGALTTDLESTTIMYKELVNRKS